MTLRPGNYLSSGAPPVPVDYGRASNVTNDVPRARIGTSTICADIRDGQSGYYCCGERREHELAATIAALPGSAFRCPASEFRLRVPDASFLVAAAAISLRVDAARVVH
jgi:hypothetical protein